MEFVKLGCQYGVYKVKNISNKRTSKGTRCFDCVCSVCGGNRTFSESYLLNSKNIMECICDKEQRKLDIKREFDYLQKNYGNVNLCGSCKYLFSCVNNRYNAIDKRIMKKYYIEKVKDYKNRRNMIIVLECEKFEFDWGEK